MADLSLTPQLFETLRELTKVVSTESLDDALERVANLSVRTIEGCTSASVTVVDDKGARTPGASDQLAIDLDKAQYASNRGPCLEAIKQGEAMNALDGSDEGRWPEFAKAAASKGVHTTFSVPMRVDGVVAGLNLYGESQDAFSEEAKELAHMFARQAAVVLENSRAYWATRALVDQLTEALETRGVIGEAKGILMARDGLDEEEAFDMLRRASQASNVKLRDVARDVVEDATKRRQ